MKTIKFSDYEDDHYKEDYYEEAKKGYDQYREELELKIIDAEEPIKSLLISMLLKMH